jgi:hypothetical protein
MSARRKTSFGEEPLNIEIQPQRIIGSALTQDYLCGAGTARTFDSGSHRELAS